MLYSSQPIKHSCDLILNTHVCLNVDRIVKALDADGRQEIHSQFGGPKMVIRKDVG